MCGCISFKMVKKTKFIIKWEESPTSYKTDRSKVIGGWLVKYCQPGAGGMTFVPDPKHEWEW